MSIKEFRFDNLPRSTQILVFAVFVVCLGFAFYWYFLKGLIKESSRLRKDVARLELTVAQGTAIESRLSRFKQELAQLEQRLAVLQSILPAQKETPTVLRSVQEMAASSNLKINKFTPQPVVPRAFYSDWPIQIEVEGNYNGLGLFFEKVSQATRIIDVRSISIKGIEDPPDASKTLSASCTATTYVFREDDPVEAPQVVEKGRKKGVKR
jgi:type IV pilus assembly protein PilO